MRTRIRRVCAALFVVFAFLPIAAFVTGVRAHEFENHRLAALPSLSDGWNFFTALPGFAKDHLPLREQGVHAYERINQDVFHDPALVNGGKGATYERVLMGTGGYWYLGEDISLKCQPVVPQPAVLARFDAIAKAVTDSGRTFLLVAAPDKSTMVPQHLPKSFFGKKCAQKAAAATWKAFDAKPWFVDIRSSLNAAKKATPYPLYLPHDSHFDGFAGSVMVKDVVGRVAPALAPRLTPVRLPTVTFPADLPTLIGRSETIDYHPVEYRTAGVVNHFTDFQTIMQVTRYQSSGPNGSLVTQPTFWFGDSFTGATKLALPSTFADLTVSGYAQADLDPDTVVDAMIRSKVIVFESAERLLAGGIEPPFTTGFEARMIEELRAHPFRS